jgi:hypothetical protein
MNKGKTGHRRARVGAARSATIARSARQAVEALETRRMLALVTPAVNARPQCSSASTPAP